MKRHGAFTVRWSVVAVYLLAPVATASAAPAITPEAGVIVPAMDPAAYHLIDFPPLPPTAYGRAGEALQMNVAKSAAFLLQAFTKPMAVSTVAFSWRSEGVLKMPNAAAERTKAGDDSLIKIGLLVASDKAKTSPLLPLFAPAWVKSTRGFLALPTDRVLFLAAGKLSPPGTRWPSPYSDSLEMLSVDSKMGDDHWSAVQVKLAEPLNVVGLWLMADGDDTESTFTTWLRGLRLSK